MRSGWKVELTLDDGQPVVFTAVEEAGTSEYELIDFVRGRHAGPPTRAVFARWIVHDPNRARAFEGSRHELFTLRHEYIDSFVCDLLLRAPAADCEYVVVGLYADDEGLAMARAHPAISEWARQHPAAQMTAEDLSGMQIGTVTSFDAP